MQVPFPAAARTSCRELTGFVIEPVRQIVSAAIGVPEPSPSPSPSKARLPIASTWTFKGSHAVTAILVYRAISLKGAVTIWALLYRHVYQRRRRTRT